MSGKETLILGAVIAIAIAVLVIVFVIPTITAVF